MQTASIRKCQKLHHHHTKQMSKQKNISKDIDRGAFHNDKNTNSTESHKNHICVCTCIYIYMI